MDNLTSLPQGEPTVLAFWFPGVGPCLILYKLYGLIPHSVQPSFLKRKITTVSPGVRLFPEKRINGKNGNASFP